MTEEKEEKKEEKKEPIRPVVAVPWVDKQGRTVFKALNKEDAETLNTALDNQAGFLVEEPEDNVCPIEPDKPYDESICKKLNELFELFKKYKKKDKKCRVCGED